MQSIHRRTRALLAGVTTAAALAVPMSAQADAAPIVKLKVANSSRLLTYVPSVGFATMKFSSEALPDQQRWEQLDGPGPTVFLRNVGNKQCLRANPLNNVFLRTAACDTSGTSAASKEQQWILSGTGQLANRDRLIREAAADSLTVDFTNVNRVVGLAPFTGAANQRWTALAA